VKALRKRYLLKTQLAQYFEHQQLLFLICFFLTYSYVTMMKMIKHKNIVKLKEVLASNSKIYLVLELIRGGDLFDVIRGKSNSLYLKLFRQGRIG
jgi:serine/threonine protein kinase